MSLEKLSLKILDLEPKFSEYFDPRDKNSQRKIVLETIFPWQNDPITKILVLLKGLHFHGIIVLVQLFQAWVQVLFKVLKYITST